MINYEILQIGELKSINVFFENGGAQNFPVDESNPNFAAFIGANPDALKKVRGS